MSDLFVGGQFAGDISQVKFGEEPKPQAELVNADGSKFITVDAKGNIVGDTSNLPQNIIDQFNDPEIREQIQAMYKKSRYGEKEKPREVKWLTKGERRDLTNLKPPGMDAKSFKRYRKTFARKMTKAAIKIQVQNRSNRG